jgi:hypothetical protein
MTASRRPAQERCYFRGLVTGDETWVSLDMKPGTIWLPDDSELPVRVKKGIASKKHMLTVFWGILGIAHCCWPPKDSTLDSPCFCESVESTRSENAAKFQTLDFDPYGQCKGSHGKGNPREIRCSSI